MATLKELYQLIHALDKSEKKNLSMMITAMGGQARQRYSNALRVINEQREFDADKLKQKLSADVSGMSLTEANGYFFNFICKSLTSGQGGTTGNLGLLKELTLVEIFLAKGLFDVAEKHLQPLLTKLNNTNSFGLLARALELQSTILASNPTTNLDYKKRMEVFDRRAEIAADNKQYMEIMRLNLRVTELIHKTGDAREKKHVQLYEPIYKHTVWQTPYDQISRQAFAMYAPLKVDMVTLSQGPVAGIKEGKAALGEFNRRFAMRDYPMPAFYLLDSILSNCYRARLAGDIPEAVNNLQKLLPHVTQKSVTEKIQARIMFSELTSELVKKNYAAGIKKLDEWMQPARKQSWHQAPLAYVNYMLGARLYYLNNNPNRALDYLLMLRGNEKTFRASTLLTYNFLLLLCYYKLDNHSLITSTASSIYKSLLKHEKLYAPERALLRFVKSSATSEKMKSNMKQLYADLQELNNDPLHASFFYLGDYMDWLKMEMEKKRIKPTENHSV